MKTTLTLRIGLVCALFLCQLAIPSEKKETYNAALENQITGLAKVFGAVKPFGPDHQKQMEKLDRKIDDTTDFLDDTMLPAVVPEKTRAAVQQALRIFKDFVAQLKAGKQLKVGRTRWLVPDSPAVAQGIINLLPFYTNELPGLKKKLEKSKLIKLTTESAIKKGMLKNVDAYERFVKAIDAKLKEMIRAQKAEKFQKPEGAQSPKS